MTSQIMDTLAANGNGQMEIRGRLLIGSMVNQETTEMTTV